MATEIHPSAIVDPAAELDVDVTIGPYAVIGAGVQIGAGTQIGSGAQVHGPTILGRDNRVFPNAAVGFDPQDLKYQGEETRLEVGDRNHFREFSTVHRGTGFGGGVTSIGDDNLFMIFTHVAHDCHVGNGNILVNNGTLAGHVTVGDFATIGAFSSVHQFCRVGSYAYIGGYSVLTRDVLPYVKTVGVRPACYGINRIGLERLDFARETLSALEAAFRVLVRSRLATPKALEMLRAEHAGEPHVDRLIEFVATSERGVIKDQPGKGSRGGA